MIGRLLCRLGLHDSHVTVMEEEAWAAVLAQQIVLLFVCSRCGDWRRTTVGAADD